MSLPSEGLSLCITPLNMMEMLVGWWDGKETRMEVELWERSAPAHCVNDRSCDTYQNFVHALWWGPAPPARSSLFVPIYKRVFLAQIMVNHCPARKFARIHPVLLKFKSKLEYAGSVQKK